MDKKQYLENKVKSTLESLEGISPAEAPDFFYTRLQARMEAELLHSNGPLAWVTNLKTSLAVLGLLMVLNVTSLFMMSSSDQQTTDETTAMDLFTQDYFSGTDNYEYLNSY